MSAFRTEDLEARVTSLRRERDEARALLLRAERQLAAMHPWSTRRFVLGALLPIGLAVAAVGLMALAASLG